MPNKNHRQGPRAELLYRLLSAGRAGVTAARTAGARAARSKWSAGHSPTVAAPASTGEGAATMADVEACYRLLLDRQPDEGGLANYRERLAGGGLTPAQLADEFLSSVEFVRRNSGRGRAERPSELATTSQGFSMWVDPTDFAVGHTVAITGDYEREVSDVVRHLLVPGATFVDVGANIGWFSLLAASLVGPAGRVLAIEPNPLNVELLDRSAKHNRFSNVKAYCVALSDRAGMAALETDGSNGRVVPLDGPPVKPVRAEFVVPAWPLDHLVSDAGLEGVDVMKVDVEGAEPLALRGAAGLLGRDRPVLVTEFYPLALDLAPWGSAQGYLDMLRAHGYRLQVIGAPSEGDKADAEIFALAGAPGHDHVDLLCIPD